MHTVSLNFPDRTPVNVVDIEMGYVPRKGDLFHWATKRYEVTQVLWMRQTKQSYMQTLNSAVALKGVTGTSEFVAYLDLKEI